jgi:carbon monoxide dehydrogenase subunit G
VRIEGERRFDAKPEDVYGALTDPEQLGEAFAAIEHVEAEGNDWNMVVRPPFPGGFRLRFFVHLDELRAPEHARLRAWGKSLGGRISVDSTFDLAPKGRGTLMRWVAEVDAAGLFAGLGSQSLGGVAKLQADRALGRLAQNLEPEPTPTT